MIFRSKRKETLRSTDVEEPPGVRIKESSPNSEQSKQLYVTNVDGLSRLIPEFVSKKTGLRLRVVTFLVILVLPAISAMLNAWVVADNDSMITSFVSQGIYDVPESRLPRPLAAFLHFDHKFGYIDSTGALKIAAKFDDAGDFHEGLAVVRNGGRWGYISSDGSLAVPLSFHRAHNFSHGLAAVKIGRFWGFIDKQGSLVVKPQFLTADDFRSNGTAMVSNLKKFGLIDRKGKFLVPLTASAIGEFQDGIARVAINDMYGFIREDGHWVSQPKYDQAGEFNEGMAAVCQSGSWGYIDRTGALVIQPKFKHASTFYDGAAVVKVADGRSGLINIHGDLLIKPSFAEMVRIPKIDWKPGSTIAANDRTPFADKRGWGYASLSTGETVIEPQFPEACPFSEGLACVAVPKSK